MQKGKLKEALKKGKLEEALKKLADDSEKAIPTVSLQSNFRQEFSTITKFDDGLPSKICSSISIDSENSQDVQSDVAEVKLRDNQSTSCNAIALKPAAFQAANINQALFMRALINILCEQFERDPVKAKLLFETICSQVCQLNIIPGFKENMKPLVHFYQESLEGLIFAAKTLIHKPEKEKIVYGSRIGNLTDWIIPNILPTIPRFDGDSRIFVDLNVSHTPRIKKEFEDISQIAKGGGGVVYKAKAIIDGCWYAVKKIPIVSDIKFSEKYNKIIKEVHVLANLNHRNIVSYKTAWMDHCSETECSCTDSSGELCVWDSELPKAKSCPTPRKSEENTDEDIIFDPQIDNDSDVPLQDAHETKAPMQFCRNRRFSRSLSCDSTNPSYSLETVPSSSAIQNRPSLKNMYLPSLYSNSYAINGNIEINIPKSHVVLAIQMELCSENLRNWLDKRNESLCEIDSLKKQDRKAVMAIFKEILFGVDYIHSEHVIHRDLKPSNILFDLQNGQPKIGDFGLAIVKMKRNLEVDCHDEQTSRVGTQPYISPEQMTSNYYDQKTDMYSLGIILFELLHPFKTTMERSKTIDRLKKGEIGIEFSRRWPNEARLINSLISVNPKDRPSAKDILKSDLFEDKIQRSNSEETADLITKLEKTKSENNILKQRIQELEAENDRLKHGTKENNILKKRIQVLEVENDRLKCERKAFHQKVPGEVSCKGDG